MYWFYNDVFVFMYLCQTQWLIWGSNKASIINFDKGFFVKNKKFTDLLDIIWKIKITTYREKQEFLSKTILAQNKFCIFVTYHSKMTRLYLILYYSRYTNWKLLQMFILVFTIFFKYFGYFMLFINIYNNLKYSFYSTILQCSGRFCMFFLNFLNFSKNRCNTR